MNRKTIILLLLVFILILLLGFFGYQKYNENRSLSSTKQEVRKLPFVENPEKFAKNFSPSGQRKTTLERKCNFLEDFLCQITYTVSSFYPNKELDTSHHITFTSEDTVSIRIDRSWNVFWLDFERAGTFGPYRSEFKKPKREVLSVEVDKKEVSKLVLFKNEGKLEVGEILLK